MRTRALSFLTLALATALPAGAALDGKTIFLAQKCSLCHSIAAAGITKTSEKMKAPDLTGKVTAANAPKLAKFLRKLEPGANGKKHTKEFKGTDEEVQAILDWLVTQKAK